MATLENIRKRGPLVAVVIGLALLAFILGDLFTKGSSMFGSSSMQIAEIWGESISVKEYQQRISSLEEIYKIQTQQSTLDERTMKGIRDQVWNQMVRDYVLKDEYKALGIGVDANELVEMVRGVNISADPMIRQIFTDQKTNTFNSAQAVEFFKNLDRDANTKAFGLYLESEMRSNRMYSKYTTLIAKGMNVTDLEARDAYKERMHMVDFNYVYKKFEGAIDTTAKITDQEIST